MVLSSLKAETECSASLLTKDGKVTVLEVNLGWSGGFWWQNGSKVLDMQINDDRKTTYDEAIIIHYEKNN